MRANRCCLWLLLLSAAAGAETLGVAVSTPVVIVSTSPSGLLTMVHPLEGQRISAISQTFALGAVTPGSTVTINGEQIAVHRSGGYLAIVPLKPGDFVLTAEARMPTGETTKLERRVTVATPFAVLPATPTALERGSLQPSDDLWLAAGDTLRVSFQGTPDGSAEFSIDEGPQRIPMQDVSQSTWNLRGLYHGSYVIQPGDKADRSTIEVTFKKGKDVLKQKVPGRLTIDNGAIPRVGLVVEDTVAARTGPEGGYDLFAYRGMKVRLTGKIGGQWRVRFSANQAGWVKESAIQELPRGTLVPSSFLTNFTMTHQGDSTILKIPLSEMLPYRTEQTLDPMQLTITLYGAVSKTDLIRYDPVDPLIRQVRWRQMAPDASQIIIQPTFNDWWGYDVRYEGNTMFVEIRKPWLANDMKGMVIAVDPGHGGSDTGATGPHGLLEKDANLQIAKHVVAALEKAGAKPFLTREKDIDVPLYERPKMAWNRNARLFISIHCNAAGEAQNPVWNNGFSIYWYQPQSFALAHALHGAYLKGTGLPDHGLYYADFAVCRMTQMPAVLTEQAFIIVPEQEQLLFSTKFQKQLATSILNGIRKVLGKR